MSPEVLLSKVCDFPPPIDSSREVLTPESRLSQLETEDPLDGNPEAESISPRSDQTEHWLLYHKQRRTALDVTLTKLCGLDLPGEEHFFPRTPLSEEVDSFYDPSKERMRVADYGLDMRLAKLKPSL